MSAASGTAWGSAADSAFAEAFLMALPRGQLRWLRDVIVAGEAVQDAHLRACPALRPLLVADEGGGFYLPGPVRDHLASRMAQMARDGGALAAITDAASRGDTDEALGALRAQGGAFISMTEGLEAAQQIADSFPEAAFEAHISLALLPIVNALKEGDLARADLLMEELSRRRDLPTLESCGHGRDPEMVCVLFMKAVYADEPVPDVALENLFATLRDLPGDASLMRGLLYNVALDIMMRRTQIAAADEAAQRALVHYQAAGETGLGFYVHLYRVIIALWRGEVDKAGDALEAARMALAMYPRHSANDAALLHSVALIQGYEAGETDAFVRHLVGGEDNIPFGELWPAIAEPILSYGRRALASHATPAAALSWVQRWRVRQWRSDRFDALISGQEALALQDLGRAQEADEVLAPLTAADHGEIQIARLASALDRAPVSEELARRLKQAIDDPAQSARQRLVLVLMAAESAAARRNEREAARWLGRAFAPPDEPQRSRVLVEERPRLARILSNRALRTELRRHPQLTRALERVLDTTAPALPEGLTRQEYRVLLLLAEAQPNKMIAQRLGVSLATVKFHVSNLLAKAGVPNRKALVRHGQQVGWLST